MAKPVACFLLAGAVASAWASGAARGPAHPRTVRPERPNVVAFAPRRARYVRFAILQSSRGQPCIDELEVYGPQAQGNLALASRGARATASSCLRGYAIHKVGHLNDGLYGNDHSWIAAGTRDEWAQIELPRATRVDKVVFSRDRKGRYRDRVPIRFSVLVSLDGKRWQLVYGPRPIRLPAQPTQDDLLRYAFACEREAWTGIRAEIAPPHLLALARMGAVPRVLKQMADLLDRLAGRGLDVSAERAELAELRRRHAAAGEAAGADRDAAADRQEGLYFDARLAKRRLFFRDPGLAALERVLFVKRHPFLPSHNYSVLLDGRFRPGGGVYVLNIPRRRGRLRVEDAALKRLFDAAGGMARTPMADARAERVYFSFRPARDDYYRLMAVPAAGGAARQLTAGRPFHDFWPCPLPDGGIAFLSTRCKCRYLCWRPQAFTLFRMEADGTRIRPLSAANLSEWAPSVMRDGRILWTRSEYQDKGADFGHTLWAIRPDGTHPELIFGNNTDHAYMNGRQVPGTGEFLCTLACHAGDLNGPLALVEPAGGRFSREAVTVLTPEVRPPIGMDGRWPRQRCFRDGVPISRDVFLCSHAPREQFGLYVIDRWGNRELLYMDAKIASVCPTPLRAVPPAPTFGGAPLDPRQPGRPARLVIQDVYRGLAAKVKRGSARYLRVCQEVRSDLARLPGGDYQQDHRPFQDYYATPVHKVRGPNGWPAYVAKGTFGLADVEADGSAHFLAPPGKVIYFQLLDAELNEIQRMRSVMQLQPGETRGCVGCHEDRAETPRPRRRPLAARRGAQPLRPPPWGAGPLSYPTVVQPVWDAACVRCHHARHEKGIDLTAALDRDRVPASYRTLIARGLVHYFDWTYARRHREAEPLTFGTLRSRLVKHLAAGHHGVKLTPDQWRRVKCWIDLNCPLWPDYTRRDRR